MSSFFNLINKNIDWDPRSHLNQYEYKPKNISVDTNTYNTYNKPPGIIIDNGSSMIKTGFSNFSMPQHYLKPVIAMPKTSTKGIVNSFFLGEDIFRVDSGKMNKKSPFEKNYITNFNAQEGVFDYIFKQIGINQESVNYDIVISEPFCNLNYSRKGINELLFELYGAKSVSWCVDSFAASYFNGHDKNGLIVSSGYSTTHVIPVIDYKPIIEKSRRISIGGQNHVDLLIQSLSLKYSSNKNKFTNEICQHIAENYTECAIDYDEQIFLLEKIYISERKRVEIEEVRILYGSIDIYNKILSKLRKPLFNISNDMENISTPYNISSSYKNYTSYNNYLLLKEDLTSNIVNDLYVFGWPKPAFSFLQEDLKRKQDSRLELGMKLKELMKKRREEKLIQMSNELTELEEIQDRKAENDEETYIEILKSKGFSNENELFDRISKLHSKVNMNMTFNQIASSEVFDENKKWPLINTPDEDLTEIQLKQKKIQKLQRMSYLSRLEKKELIKKEKEKVENLKKNDPDGYLFDLLIRKKESLDKLERFKKMRKEMQSRRTKNNLSRMMVMAELGKEKEKTKIKSRKKEKENENEDDFGKNDDDWEVYRGIAKNSFSDEEEEEKNNLEEIEELLLEMKPDYIMTSEIGNYINESDVSSKLYLGIDQFRGVEILFKPYLIGIDKAGLSETIECVVKQFNKEDQRKLLGNVFLCGGNMSYKNIERRIYNEIRGFADYDIDVKVNKSKNTLNDCWNGLRKFHYEMDDSVKISKAEYEEKGVNCFKWNRYSNLMNSKVN